MVGEREKGKGIMVNSGDDNEDPNYPPGFTPTNVRTRPDAYLSRAPITIRPQKYPVGTLAPMNYQTGSSSNLGDNPTNPVVLDLDEVTEMEKAKAQLPKQLEDRCKWLEKKFRAMENVDYHCRNYANDLSLVPDLVLPPEFKTPEFKKYNGTSCPEAHITMFCRRMIEYVNNDQLLIHCFQDSLIGSVAKWYNQLSRAQVNSWKDLAQAFMKQYSHVTDITLDRITLQNMENKQNESFRQYTQRWREVATQVQPPLLEKETTMLFINTLKAPFINHMLGSATKSFSDIVMSGEMIENTVRSGEIDAGESAKRSALRKKENGVNNVGAYNKGYSKKITVGPPKTTTTSFQTPPRQEPSQRTNTKRLQFTPILMTYRELYQSLFDAHVNPLPNHIEGGVNAIDGKVGRIINTVTVEIKTPLKRVWMEMVKRRLSIPNSGGSCENSTNYCEFHHEEGHKIHECTEFRALVQGLMDNKEIEFCEEAKEEGSICASESTTKVPKVNHPVVIISQPQNNEVGVQAAPKIIIQKPTIFSYQDSKRVPWNYDCNVTIPGRENSASTSKEDQDVTKPTKEKTLRVEQKKEKVARPEPLVNEPVKEEEVKKFLKFLKYSEYSVVEHALMKVLNEIYVANDISANKLDRLVNNISADNFIFFNDDEIPPGGMESTKALHITTRCKGYTLPRVLSTMDQL
ncbi:hypothetical protein EPI10_030407 [Gossypium australe]|uniref:Retrotransposon gag domain-containing protein n=1 Tax=Gossypium australe TaxID=47621 RepID=A0A5B6WZR3_9ROSI|nr:hypothetical protein EPI10_030407 [Gossypium australe]